MRKTTSGNLGSADVWSNVDLIMSAVLSDSITVRAISTMSSSMRRLQVRLLRCFCTTIRSSEKLSLMLGHASAQ
jgi:hypothetical protein